MNDPRSAKLADVLVNYSVGIKPGDWVVIQGDVLTVPMLEDVYRAVLRAGGYANILIGSTGLTEIFFKEANDDQLTWISPLHKIPYYDADVLISLLGSSNTRNLSGVDPSKIAKSQGARREISMTYMKRSAEGALRWVLTMFPNNANAQESEMSLSEYEDFVYGATFADKDDPVNEWQKFHDRQQVVVDWLKGKK